MAGTHAPDFGSKNYDAGGTGVEQTNAILEPDPADESATPFRRRRVQTLCPEHRLLMAMLETALHLVVATPKHRRRTSIPWQEAHDWIFSDALHEFSFIFACEHLEIDHDIPNIRAGIQRKLATEDRRPLLVQSRSAERARGPRKPIHQSRKPFYQSRKPFYPKDGIVLT